MKATCYTCKWWDNQHPRLKFAPQVDGIANPGFCRKHKPGAYSLENYHIGVQPIMDGAEYCAEYRAGE
jgi:hypothetical protein